MTENKPFPWHYRERERTRRRNLLQSNCFPTRLRSGLTDGNILDETRSSIFRNFWQLPPDKFVDLTILPTDEDRLLDVYNEGDLTPDQLMSLVVCLRYNGLLSAASLALLITTFTPAAPEDDAQYQDVLFLYKFMDRYQTYFDEALLKSFSAFLQNMVVRLPSSAKKKMEASNLPEELVKSLHTS
jgi:hypothetical protein